MYLEIDIFRHFCLLYRHFTFLLLFIDILLLSCVCVPCIAFQFIALLFHLSVVSFWVIALLALLSISAPFRDCVSFGR